MESEILYNFSYTLVKSFEEAKDRNDLLENFSKALRLFFTIDELKIYMMDEYSFLLKDFTKPWENLAHSEENLKIKKQFDNFLIQKSTYEIDENTLYFPICQKNKTLGIVKLKSCEKINPKNNFFEIFTNAVSAQYFIAYHWNLHLNDYILVCVEGSVAYVFGISYI